jgi:hypothetical protein
MGNTVHHELCRVRSFKHFSVNPKMVLSCPMNQLNAWFTLVNELFSVCMFPFLIQVKTLFLLVILDTRMFNPSSENKDLKAA